MSTPTAPTAPTDPTERDVDLAWELYEAQPTHPEIGRLAARVLAQQPGRNGIRILLALHRKACGAVDEARELLLVVAGQRDSHFVNAARTLRDLEQHACHYDEARRWADLVLREDQESALDWLELGIATAMCGDLEAGWQLMDEGVALSARTDPDDLPHVLSARAIYLMQSWAPAERFIPAAEEAMRADPSSAFIGGPLAWAYLRQGRFDDAEQLVLRMLRLDPTDGMAATVLTLIREWRAVVAKGKVSLAEIHESGVVEWGWVQKRDELVGTDLASALTALEPLLSPELRAALRPPLDAQVARSSTGEAAILAWHDGQKPGTGALWGADGDFRLMSSAEITAMDAAIEADPEAHPQWRDEELSDYYEQVMTDDRGGYVIVTMQNLLVRRAEVDDVVVAPNLASWFWDRVAAFGGLDPRPHARPEAALAAADMKSAVTEDAAVTEDGAVSEDAAVQLIGSLGDHLRGAHDGWESWSIVIEVGGGRVRGTSGYAYGPGAATSAVAARPSGVTPAVQAYLASYFASGDALPVKLLVQLDRTSGRYTITFEDTDTSRWKVTPANLDALREELRPRFEG